MRYQQCLLVAAFAGALAVSCRKDADSTPPTVRITSPGAGYSVGIPDTITVGVAVSDDREVKSVTVLIADVDGVPIAAAVQASVNARSKEFSVDLPVTSERIVSGQYVLTAIASDGTNSASDFLSIAVQAAPLRIRSMFLVPPSDVSGPYTISRLDSLGAISPFVVVPELSHASIGLDHLFTAGTSSQPFERRRITTGAVQALMPNPGLWPRYFTGVSKDLRDGRIYVCGADGALRGYTADGASSFSATLPSGYSGDAVAAIGDAILCSAHDPVAQQSKLMRLGASSGSVLAQFNSDARAIALFEIDAQRLILFGNTATGGVIQEVNASLGGTFTMRSFPGEQLQCVARVSQNLYSLGFGSGIKRFDYPSTATTTLMTGMDVRGLTYDPVSGAVLAASGSSITAFDPTLGTDVSVQMAPHPVASVLLQTNR